MGFIGQTSYERLMPAWIPGMIVDNSAYHCEAFPVDENIGFGLGVVAGAVSNSVLLSGGSVKLPDANTDVFRGVTILERKESPFPFNNNAEYKAGDAASVLRKGRIVVQTDGTCNIDSTVYVTTDGKFTSTQGTNAVATGCVFRAIDSSLGLAVLEVNLP